MWDSRPRLSGQMTADAGCPAREKVLDLLFRCGLEILWRQRWNAHLPLS